MPPPSPSRSASLQVPNLDAWVDSVQLAWVIAAGLMFLGAVVSYGLASSNVHLFAAGLIASFVVPTGLAAFAYLKGPLWKRSVSLRRVGEAVLGAPGGPLPVQKGRVTVERKRRRSGESHHYVYVVRFASPGVERILFERERNATRVRAFAEGLCRMGGWEMVWRGVGGDEVRGPAELDLSLVERLRRRGPQTPEEPFDPPARPSPVRRTAGGSAIGNPQRSVPALLVLMGMACVVGGGLWFELADAGIPQPFSLFPVALSALACVWLLIEALAIRYELEVDPVRIRYRVFFLGKALSNLSFEVDRVESLYIEGAPMSCRLVIAGDGFYRAVGRYGGALEAKQAREQVLSAMLGEG